MKSRLLISLLAIAAVLAFAILNWEAITTPTPLSLGVVAFVAPIGLIMLGLLAIVAAIFYGYAALLRRRARREAREQAHKLEVQRELAERAEASRFTQLQDFIVTEVQQQKEREARRQTEIIERLERVERALRPPVQRPAGVDSTASVTRREPALARES